MTLKAENFEEMLAGELNRTLEPQRGKALAAFRAQVAAEGQRPAVAGTIKGREISRGETWFWASVPSLAAACLAVVVTLKLLGGGAAGTGATGITPTGNDPMADNQSGVKVIISPHVEQREQFALDNGTRDHMQQFKWTDPNDNSSYKLTSDEQETPVKAPF